MRWESLPIPTFLAKTIDKRKDIVYNGTHMGERFSGFRILNIDLKDAYQRVFIYVASKFLAFSYHSACDHKKRMKMQSYQNTGGSFSFLSPKRERSRQLPPRV